MKYLKGAPLRSISYANTPPGTSIWNSCRKSFGFFTQQLFRIPENGKSTLLWNDKISGNPALSSFLPLTEILNWATNKGLIRLADFCIWDHSGNWSGWSFPDLPIDLLPQKLLLFSFLSGLAPIHLSLKYP